MKEVADEARGKEELHKQLVIRLSGFSSAFDNVFSIPVNSFLRYTSDRNVNNSEAFKNISFSVTVLSTLRSVVLRAKQRSGTDHLRLKVECFLVFENISCFF